MKFAAFNVENLFDRPKAFNQDGATSTEAIEAVAELNRLFELPSYDPSAKERMIELAGSLRLNRFNEGPLALIRKIRGKIFRRPVTGGVEVVAGGRDDWVGWAELKKEHVDEIAVLNTGRVIRDVDADVLAVIEAENRVVLKRFTEFVLDKLKDEVSRDVRPYTSIMLIDGNDDRGIDVGLMAKEGFDVGLIRSHIHDLKSDVTGREVAPDELPATISDENPIFSRDCPEYQIITPGGEKIWVLPNHFKSKFGGNSIRSRNKRKAQAIFTRIYYERLRAAGEENVIVLGDLNDTADSDALQPLLANSDLRDVSEHEDFDPGEFPGIGTYKLGNDSQKIDYLLLSPALFSRVTAAGLFRKGAWPGKRPVRWTVYPQITREIHVASDHHVIWVEID
jgi:endonuclease/exonuclease/phosphatase family metal-dependent hydrolase